jgi:hypothetical protein
MHGRDGILIQEFAAAPARVARELQIDSYVLSGLSSDDFDLHSSAAGRS